ncbi:nucleophile aminohydrolase [Pisolithus tinctorius]|nr:nucleophile aminohydrolase [Pisolithus tinctorius]
MYRGPGFDFSNSLRNDFLQHKGVALPKATSTGTTIVGCIFKDGIILGADTRATEGEIVADKNCEKIHYIAESIRCCGAGTAADTEFVTAAISSNIELHALSTGRKPRVVAAMTMLKQYLFQYQGHVGAALVLGGVDSTGAHLFTVHPHGSTDKLPYVTMGSGSLAAMAVFENGWKPNMEREEALKLVCDAVAAGIFNDLGSGSNIDACVITATHTEMLRNFVKPNERVAKELKYGFRHGTTAIKSEHIRSLVVSEEITPIRGEAMDVS